MNVPLRIMVTVQQKDLIDQAVAMEGGKFAAWARPILLEAARRKLARAMRARVNSSEPG